MLTLPPLLQLKDNKALVVGWVAHEILVSAPVPFWGFWVLGT